MKQKVINPIKHSSLVQLFVLITLSLIVAFISFKYYPVGFTRNIPNWLPVVIISNLALAQLLIILIETSIFIEKDKLATELWVSQLARLGKRETYPLGKLEFVRIYMGMGHVAPSALLKLRLDENKIKVFYFCSRSYKELKSEILKVVPNEIIVFSEN